MDNLPLHDMNQNRIWCAIVSLALELTAWMQMLALTEHPARRWEPKRLRLTTAVGCRATVPPQPPTPATPTPKAAPGRRYCSARS